MHQQIEHHLFPVIAHTRLAEIAPIVKVTSFSFPAANLLLTFKNLSNRARAPNSDCPIMSTVASLLRSVTTLSIFVVCLNGLLTAPCLCKSSPLPSTPLHSSQLSRYPELLTSPQLPSTDVACRCSLDAQCSSWVLQSSPTSSAEQRQGSEKLILK